MATKPKILIVDDNEENLFTLESILRTTEAEIIQANTGQEALKAMSEHDFALLVLDVKMPGMDGYELAELIRGRKKTSHLPIIFLSAVYADDLHVFKGYESGAVDFMTKPFNHEILLNKVRIFLELDTQKRHLKEVVTELQHSNLQLTQLNMRLNHEIVERQQTEERLQRYTNELQQANEELSQYAYIVSHDLKAPLRAIHNYADFLHEDLESSLNEETSQYFRGIQAALQEANILIDDILALSRVGQRDVICEPVQWAEFFRSLLNSLQLPADSELVMPDSWPSLESEPVLLRQIFQNLISNAVKFNTSSPKRVEIAWREREQAYEFSVRDNGIGIEAAFHDKIFRMFDRLHTKDEFEGSGIGLAIVKKAVTKLGGTVWLESELGQGCTFWVNLPKTCGKTESSGRISR